VDRPVIGITVDIDGDRLALRANYAEAVQRAGGLPLLLPPEGGPGEYAGRLDGLLIPGGDDMEPAYYGEEALPGLRLVPRRRSDFEIALFHEIIRQRKPVLGICYGMQLVNVALGGSLYQDIKGQLPRAADHSKGHQIEIRGAGPMQAGTYRVNSTHHQAVKALGRGLQVLAVSPDGLAEALYMRGYPYLLCVQWHPERPEGLPEMVFNPFIEASRVLK
jgi:putative glutamine amidotransferase